MSTVVRQVDAERFEVVLPDGVVVVTLSRASREALGLRSFGPSVVVAAAVDLLLEHGETVAASTDGHDVLMRLARHPGLLEELRARVG